MLLVLLLLHFASSSVLFSSTLPPTSPFSTKIPFTATYTGVDSVSWSTTDNTCSQTSVTTESSEFLCGAAGYHKITLTDSGGDTDYSIYTEHSPACYTWAIANTTDKLHVWITDGDQSSDDFISKQFYFIGETPKVTVQCDKTLTTLTAPTFNITLNKWELSQTLIAPCVGRVLLIQSVPALLFGCTVADTTHSIHQERYTLAGSTTLNSTITKLCVDHCHSGAAVLLNESLVYYTPDLFTSNSSFVTDLAGLGSVKDCGVSYDQIVLVMDNDEVIIVSKDNYTRTSGASVEKVTVNSQCKVTLEESYKVSDILLWSSLEAMLGAKNLTLPGDYDTIIDAQISYIGATFLLANASNVNLFSMDLTDYSFSDAGVSLDCTSNCSIHAMCPHTLLMTDDSKLYMVAYGADNGIRVTDYSNSSPLSLDIEMIASSTSHTFAVLTTSKDIYFGYCSLTTLIRLSSSVSEAEWLVFGSDGVLYYIDSSLIKHPLPLPTLLQSQVSTFWCPVQDFYTDIKSSLKFLDKFESLDISVNSRSSPFYQAEITYQINSHSLIQIQSISDESIYSQGVGINQHKQQVKLFEKDTTAHSTGVAVMVVQSNAVDVPCTSQHSEVMYVAVGCKPGRTIRVLDKQESCPYLQYSNQTIPIPAAYTSNSVSSDYVYNYTQLGCPLVWAHDNPFVPNVWIYDDDVPVRQLANNYILKELNNRTDYKYTQSASNVGCKRAAQTWETMGDGWSKENYVSCFETDSNDYSISQQSTKYEILNSTSYANISFEKHKANYTFQLTVIDPDASFCSLTTYFAVEVSDAPETSNIGVYVLFLTCALMVIVLVVSYFSYKKQILDKAKAVLEAG